MDLVELCHDISEYTSLLRNKEFFSENSTSRSSRSMNPFKTASNWTAPLGRNNYLDSYINKIEKELDVLVHDLNTSKVKQHDNLSSNQRRARHDMKRNNDIVMKPADKGGSIVIMNKDNYSGDNDPEPSRGVPRGDAAFGRKSSNPAQHTQLALWEAHNPPLRRPELPTQPCISGYVSLGRGRRGEPGARLLRVHRYHPRWIPSNHQHPMPASLPWVPRATFAALAAARMAPPSNPRG